MNHYKSDSIKSEVIENKHDVKKFWRLLKGLLSENRSTPSSHIQFEDCTLVNDRDIAAKFIEFFVDSINEIH